MKTIIKRKPFMSGLVIESKVKNGHIDLDNIPLPDDKEVCVYVVPKADLSKMNIEKLRDLTKTIPGNLSDEVDKERGER